MMGKKLTFLLASCATLLVTTATTLAGERDYPRALKCGEYELRGMLITSPSGTDVLELIAGTTNRFQIVLRKLKPIDSMDYEGRLIRLRANISEPDDGKGLRAQVVEVYGSITKSKALDEPMRLIQESSCNKAATHPK
jgi:hypothetical protein